MGVILKAENISKQYRLGNVGTGTIKHDFNRFWHRIHGKEDPYLKVGAINDRSSKTKSEYVWALRDINFEVQEGEVLGIIGKNGAGKSTLLKILSRVTSPTTGVIKTKGRIASLLEVGTGFHSELTGRENIYLNGAILGMTQTEIASKIEEIIEFSGCQLYIDTPVKRYSSGMTVRLGFAVAAHLEPDILVVDEVLAVGDAEFQKKAIGKMQNMSRGQGRTVLFVSHNMAAVRSLCTRVLVLENGGVIFEGDTDDGIRRYLSTSSSETDLQLLNREDRLGSGKWKASNVKFFDKTGKEIFEMISGEQLTIQVSYNKYAPVDVAKLFFGIAILDSQQQKVGAFLSDEMDCNFIELENRKTISLVIPNFLLRAGNYSLTLQLGEGSTLSEDFIDLIENAVRFSVLPGDFWNIGRANRYGEYCIIPGRFEVI